MALITSFPPCASSDAQAVLSALSEYQNMEAEAAHGESAAIPSSVLCCAARVARASEEAHGGNEVIRAIMLEDSLYLRHGV